MGAIIINKDMNINEIEKICNGKKITFGEEGIICNFTIDSRNVHNGDCFIGVKGETHNGNLYIEAAFDNGALLCIVDEMPKNEVLKKYENKNIILVKNSVKALQNLATYKRSLYNIPVIAVTGSVGKTSTKDIIASVLSKKYNVLKTEGNLNNHIGLPLTILKLRDHNALVVEMGMNHFGEISLLTNIAKPTIAVITNIGTSHIGNLGSRENILKAKLEILEGLSSDGKIVINNDNDLLHQWSQSEKNKNIITYGIENISNYMAKDIIENDEETNYKIHINNKEYDVKVPVIGRHFVYNSLCAFAVAQTLNMDVEQEIKGIEEFKLTSKRMDFIKIKNNAIVLADYYNASYDSMKSALEVVKNYNASRKIAVLGDMLELGHFSKELHEKVGEEVYKNNIDILITVGELSKNIAKNAEELGTQKVFVCKNNKEAIEILNKNIQENDLILLKASNAMKFGEILKGISR